MQRLRLKSRFVAAILAVTLVIAGWGVSVSAPVSANWVGSQVSSGSFSTSIVNPPRNLTCTAGLLQPVVFKWQAPAVDAPITGYRWVVQNSLVTKTGTLSASATSVTISSGLIDLGSYDFSLYALSNGVWESVPVTGDVAFVSVILGLTSSCAV